MRDRKFPGSSSSPSRSDSDSIWVSFEAAQLETLLCWPSYLFSFLPDGFRVVFFLLSASPASSKVSLALGDAIRLALEIYFCSSRLSGYITRRKETRFESAIDRPFFEQPEIFLTCSKFRTQLQGWSVCLAGWLVQ